MNRVVIADPFRSQLGELQSPVEFVDESGNRLGHFVPAPTATAPDQCPYTEQELERMRHEQGGKPLSEIWAALGAK